jgi:alpha-L-arabinofuranosidase
MKYSPFFLLGLLSAALGGECSGDPVITISPSQLRFPPAPGTVAGPLQSRISPELMGFNLFYTDEKDAMWGAEKTALSALQIGFVRYPGGEVTSYFHWESPNGHPFKDSWIDPTPAVSKENWMDLGEYAAVLKNQPGTKPLIGVNMQSQHRFLPAACRAPQKPLDPTGGAPRTDAQWWPTRYSAACKQDPGYAEWQRRLAQSKVEADRQVRKAMELKMTGATYFLDNEAYDQSTTNPMSSIEYAMYVKEYATLIRGIDAGAKFVVNWQNRPESIGYLLNIACRHIHYVDFHLYWHQGHKGPVEPGQVVYSGPSFDDWRKEGKMMVQENGYVGDPPRQAYSTYTRRVLDFRDLIEQRGCLNLDGERQKLAVFEWNIGGQTEDPTGQYRRPSRTQAALMASEMFLQFINGGLDAAAFFKGHFETPEAAPGKTVFDEGYRGLLSSETLQITPVYKALSLFRSILGAQVLKPVSAWGSGIYEVAAYWPGDDKVTVILLEKLGSTREVTLQMDDFISASGQYSVDTRRFQGARGDSYLDYAELIDDVPYVLDRAAGKLRITLPAYTLTKVIVHRR